MKSVRGADKVINSAKGGAHVNVKGILGNESHHMPANSVSPLSKDKGPAISMKKEDHYQTASWGSSKEAQAYREEQRKIIEQGKFKEAQKMDIDDVQSKFGDQYNDVINQMLDYTDTLDF